MMTYLFILIICLILSHFISWFLLFEFGKCIDKRLDYITLFISDTTEWIKVHNIAHSNDDH